MHASSATVAIAVGVREPGVLKRLAARAERRTMEFVRKNGMWTVNGVIWDDVVASGFSSVVAYPVLNAIEIWEFVNNSGGWFHPIHVHLIDFKILSRNGRSPFPHEGGPNDTVYVGEGERGA